MKIKTNRKNSVIIFLLLLLIIINFIFLTLFNYKKVESIFELELVILIVFAFFISTKKNGIISETNIFLLFYVLFLCILPIENFFKLINIKNANIISYSYSLSDLVYIKALFCLLIGLIASIISILIFNIDFQLKNLKNELIESYKGNFDMILFIIYLIMVIMSIPYLIFNSRIVSGLGYGSIFNSIESTGITKISEIANSLIFPFFITSLIINKQNKYMKQSIVVYACWSALNIFGGKRSTVILGILFSIWFYNKYVKSVNISKFMIIIALLLCISSFMLTNRGIGSSNTSNISDNGSSIYVLCLSIENEEILNSKYCNESRVPYIFGLLEKDIKSIYYKMTFQDSPYSSGQTIDTLQNSSYLGWELTYLISSNSYLSGYGVGSSYIAEAYLSFGYIGVFFVTIFIFMLISFFQKGRSNIKFIIYISMINSFFMMPRASFFNFLISMLTIIIVYLFVTLFRNIVISKNINKITSK